MKKYLLPLSLSLLLLTACSSDESPSTDTTSPATSDQTTQTPATSETEAPAYKASFLSGDDLPLASFQAYDLTAIYLWSTWSDPSIQQMAELERLYHMLPKNLNLITICQDADTKETEALAALESAQVSFTTYIPNRTLNSDLLSDITAFPTTIFIDGEGNIVGETLGSITSGSAEAGLLIMQQTEMALNAE